MKLKELRKAVKVFESLDDEATVFVDFCGYTSDNEWVKSIKVLSDEEDVYLGSISFGGDAYKS